MAIPRTKLLCLSGAAFPQVDSLKTFLAGEGVAYAQWYQLPGAKAVQDLFQEMQDGETVLQYFQQHPPTQQQQKQQQQQQQKSVIDFPVGAVAVEAHPDIDAMAQLLSQTQSVSDRLLRVVQVARVKVRRAEEYTEGKEDNDDGANSKELDSICKPASARTSAPASLESRWLVEVSQKFPDGRERQRGSLLSEKMLSGQDETWQAAAIRGIMEELGDAVPNSDHIRLLEHTYCKEETVENSHSYPGMMSKYILHNVDALVEGLPTHKFTTKEFNASGDVRLESTWDWHSSCIDTEEATILNTPVA